jgi:gas vesicle protein
MGTQRNASNVWPYVIGGAAIGGAVGYLLLTESGRKVRRAVTHPDELADTVENARSYIESQAKIVTGQVRSVIDKAKAGLEEGQRAYHEAGQSYISQMRQIEGKNSEIASNVHKTVDNVSRTAYTVEESVLNPIFELGALYRGFERAVRAVFASKMPEQRQVSSFYKNERFSG